MRIRPWMLVCLALLPPMLSAESAVITPSSPSTPPQASGVDDNEKWLLDIIHRIHRIKPDVSMRPDVERILSIQRGLSGSEQFYHFPGYSEIQVKVTYRLDPGGDPRKDVVAKVDPPFLVESTLVEPKREKVQ